MDLTRIRRSTGTAFRIQSPDTHNKPKEGWKVTSIATKTTAFFPTRQEAVDASKDFGKYCPECKALAKEKAKADLKGDSTPAPAKKAAAKKAATKEAAPAKKAAKKSVAVKKAATPAEAE